MLREPWYKATRKKEQFLNTIYFAHEKENLDMIPIAIWPFFPHNTFIGSYLTCCHYLILISVLVAETLPKITSALWAITSIPCDTNTLQVPRIITAPDWGKVPACYCILKKTPKNEIAKPFLCILRTSGIAMQCFWQAALLGTSPIPKDHAACNKIGKGEFHNKSPRQRLKVHRKPRIASNFPEFKQSRQ